MPARRPLRCYAALARHVSPGCPVLSVWPQNKLANESMEGGAALGLRVQTVTIPSGDIAYIDEGSGPVVLLVHGGPLTSLGFVRVVRALRDHYHVIAPDLPGFGQSRAHASFGGSLADYAQSIAEFTSALNLQRLVLFGCAAGTHRAVFDLPLEAMTPAAFKKTLG